MKRIVACLVLLAAASLAHAQAPSCTLNASPTSTTAGSNVTLSASCSPAATTYNWSANTGFNNTSSSGIVTPSQTTTYTVSGTNNAGTGGQASVTVTVTGAGSVPQCSLTAVPNTISPGGSSSLIASCNPAATSYVWTNANISGSSGSVSPTTTTTYSVAGVNSAGQGPPASATVTVSGGSSSPPQCTLTASPATVGTGGSSTLTASCTPAATSYVWTNVSFGPSTSSGSVSPTSTTTYTVRGSNSAGAGNTASVTVTVSSGNAQNPNAPGPYSGIWWKESESGWGIQFTQRSGNIFAAWYTYDSAGNPKWYVVSNCPLSGTSCSGRVLEVNGPTFFGTTFDPTKTVVTDVGSIFINFLDVNRASMSYTVAGQSRPLMITRQPFGSGTEPAINHTDMWWNPNESGWGIAITQRFSNVFMAWYIYDANGRGTWLVAPECVMNAANTSCTSAIYRTHGPAWGPTFNSSQVTLVPPTGVGNMTLTFTDADHGTISYTVDGVAGTKSIQRQIF